nr:segregation/condensation protein A [Clostridium caldaquaticum]
MNIKIDNFEGPFDLLLHLIKKNKMDIYNIMIYEITNQYLEYINAMKEMDLEVTSEFIVIAATLLEIKSKMLLPSSVDEEVAAESDNDPRKVLVDKLVEYKKFKYVAQFLRSREQNFGIVFSKKPEIIEDRNSASDDKLILNGTTMLDLYNIYNELINKYKEKINKENIVDKEIVVDIYKIEDKITFLREKVSSNKNIVFSSIIKECSNKIEVVVTFLALLELIKLKSVKVVQETNFSEIYLERIEEIEKELY